MEYAINLATSAQNNQTAIIPTTEDIDEIKKKLSQIMYNIGFYELSAEASDSSNINDHWLKWHLMENSLHVRGNGYQSHVIEIYKETFAPHDEFLKRFYGFDSKDILETITRLDFLIMSKIGNTAGAMATWQRFNEWSSGKGKGFISKDSIETEQNLIQQFLEDNPDLSDQSNPMNITLQTLDNVSGYNKIFWVIPETDKQKKLFELLSQQFGDNISFTQGKFSGFPLGDSLVNLKPLIKVNEKFYCFSTHLPFRNIFNITANLLQLADGIYYDQYFRGNKSYNSRDNYIERKTKEFFEKLLPDVRFYHSLKYNIIEEGIGKNAELDILGIGSESIYIIEVKAGELNKKHRRGAILGLKDRLTETINEGSYQCFRAEKFIKDDATPQFTYNENANSNILKIDMSRPYNLYKIVVTYEYFSTLSVNLKYLIDAGVLNTAYKWAWTVSLYDLMIFSELIENEADFIEYLNYRLSLYERSDYEFADEIDILGFFLDNNFPLPPEKENEKKLVMPFRATIDEYYAGKVLNIKNTIKPIRKR